MPRSGKKDQPAEAPAEQGQEPQGGRTAPSLYAVGLVTRYEVSHQYNRRRVHIGDKTRLVIDVPGDIGNLAAGLEAMKCELSITAMRPAQDKML
jgi:hypothetical protein